MSKIELDQGRARACKCDGFHDLVTFAEAPGPFRAQGSALTRNVTRSHGSKNLLQRVILYRHKKIYVGKGRLQANTGETICTFWMVI